VLFEAGLVLLKSIVKPFTFNGQAAMSVRASHPVKAHAQLEMAADVSPIGTISISRLVHAEDGGGSLLIFKPV
jgi:hypothetical protein